MKLFHAISLMAVIGSLMGIGLSEKASANVADDLNIHYNKIVDNCGTANRPGFLCSGNLIRFTSTSRNYHTWDPSPISIKNGGVSFIYLRKDINVLPVFSQKTSGIIYYPSMLKPVWAGKAEVLCSFATDGWTYYRQNICGATIFYRDSYQCQAQGVNTADAWYKHFLSVSANDNNRFKHQCAFNMAIGQQNSAAAFNENLKAINKAFSDDNSLYISNQNKYNEIVIKTWPTDVNGQIIAPEKLPIQAFFYLVRGDENGLVDAQYYQQDYYNLTGIWIPIVKMNPNAPNDIQFSYNAADQQVKLGCSN